jgi:hypothetical protein
MGAEFGAGLLKTLSLLVISFQEEASIALAGVRTGEEVPGVGY